MLAGRRLPDSEVRYQTSGLTVVSLGDDVATQIRGYFPTAIHPTCFRVPHCSGRAVPSMTGKCRLILLIQGQIYLNTNVDFEDPAAGGANNRAWMLFRGIGHSLEWSTRGCGFQLLHHRRKSAKSRVAVVPTADFAAGRAKGRFFGCTAKSVVWCGR